MTVDAVWMVLSMVAFSLFLLAFAWSLLRPAKQPSSAPVERATEQFAQGNIDADDFERVLRGIKSGRP
jgi:uncharacterized membrane protein